MVEARLSYRLELVDIFDVAGTPGVDDPGVADVFEEEGEDLVSKVGLTFSAILERPLSLRARASVLRSSLSMRASEVISITTRLKGGTAQFIHIRCYEQSLSIIARAGNVSPFGQSDTVLFTTASI